MTRAQKISIAVLGLALMAGGFILIWSGEAARRAFDADPGCSRSITIDTAPKLDGTTCKTYAGIVQRTYQSQTKGSSTNHVVVALDRGPVVDIPLSSARDTSSMFEDIAASGEHAVVETLNGTPISIATADGTSATSNDPRGRAPSGLGVLLVGVLLALLGAFVPAREKLPKSDAPPPLLVIRRK